MNIKYFVDSELIPNDGSKQILDLFEKNIDFSKSEIVIFPDIHYKKGSRVVNGMLIKSNAYIFPAMLGVENCGFTWGKIKHIDEEKLKLSFDKFSKKIKSYESYKTYTKNDVLNLFFEYIEKDYNTNIDLYNFLKLQNSKQVIKKAKKALTKRVLERTQRLLCSLGGGNHFFEIHKLNECIEQSNLNIGDYIFILHSDSIGFGDQINLRYSNLSELDSMKEHHKGRKTLRKIRRRQFLYFLKKGMFFKDLKNTINLLYSQKDYRTIPFNSCIGKELLFEHHLAELFGEINRDLIIKNWSEENNIKLETYHSHNHDSITLRKEDSKYYIIHRNGVQNINQDKYFMLPSAMGNYSYILKNPKNKNTYYSANHGTGRIQDKHIAKDCYTDSNTIKGLEEKNIKFYHIGDGSMAEQNFAAFKNVESVLQVMKKYNLGIPVAKLEPKMVIKG